MDCNIYNQYYSDIVVDGKIINGKCFKGSQVYNKNFKVNSYNKYNGPGYYSWINENFKQYSFPEEKLDEYLSIMKNWAKESLRVLKDTGSLFLNIGDKYEKKG